MDSFYDRAPPPTCFTKNTSKEELVLEHIHAYERNFKIHCDPTRSLLLIPKNEFNLQKFICTTIRPTKMPNTKLYEWKQCAEFISHFLEYEELEKPNKYPEWIPSPANVLNWQVGDCFDFSIVLCSALLGAGYDAYVVYGTAPKYITTKNESRLECPLNLEMSDDEAEEDPEYDQDASLMREKEAKDNIKPVEDFGVEQIRYPISRFDEEEKVR